jgi:hypothetical protein
MEPGETYQGPERRNAERYRVTLNASWVGKRATRPATVTDLSVGGCFVLAEDLVEPEELVRIEVELPNQERLVLWGHVIYRMEEIGFGVRFSRFMQEDDRSRLRWLVKAESMRSK